jgi:methyl-accepting chemotaxis protein
MRWDDIKLSKKIMIGIGSAMTMLLIVGIWGVLGISGVITGNRNVSNGKLLTEELLQREVDHLNWAKAVSSYVYDDRLKELKVELDHTKCAFGKWYYGDGRKNAESTLPELKETLMAVEEPHRKLHESAAGIIKVYNKAEYGTHGKKEAEAIYTSQTQTQLAAVQDSLKKLAEISKEKVSSLETRTLDKANRTRATVIGISFLGIIIGIILSIFITRSITNPLRDGVSIANKLAEGDLSVDIEVRGQDETGKLMASMKTMAESIKALTNDAGMLVQSAVEGRLATRADVAKHQGEYRKIVEGINRIMDTLVGFMDSMPIPAMIIDKEFSIQYMNRTGANILGISQKQLVGEKCYNHFKTSDCNTDKCACGQAMRRGIESSSETDAHPAGLNLEISYIALPVKDQKGAIIGAFEVVVDQTAVKKAARVAKKVADYQSAEALRLKEGLNRMAQGDLDFSLEVAEGDADTALAKQSFEEITSAVTGSMEALKQLVADADMLINAATEGRLATRADATKHRGDYRKIVEGVNKTLDAVIGPLKTAAEYVDKISKGEIPQEITDSYKGDFNEIKNNLNIMIKNLTEVVKGIQDAAGYVANGSQEMSTNSEQMSQGATEQAASVEEVSSSMEQMVANIRQNADNSQQTAKISEKAAISAMEGGHAVMEAVTAMKEIAGKISIIEEIARQTNLLALNAAIEAARAGEHGKGFAVVASEVRKLAERSQTAAAEISELSVRSTGVAEKAGEMLTKLVPDIQKTAELVQEISVASNEQNAGTEQINKAIQQLDQVIQQNAGASEEMASTAEELFSQAEQLQNTIAFFKLNNAGNGIAGKHRMKEAVLKSGHKTTIAHIKKETAKPVMAAVSAKPAGVTIDMGNGGHDKMDDEFEKF